jgi:hypothetical protein
MTVATLSPQKQEPRGVSVPEQIPAIAVHAGDEVTFLVVTRVSGTTACSAVDALSATNFVFITLATPGGDTGHITVISEHEVTRVHEGLAA